MKKEDWKSRLLEHHEDADKGPMWKRVLRIGAGIVFLILGILGFFLPILQGFLFTIIGLTLLSRESRRVRRLLFWLRGREQPDEALPPEATGEAQSGGSDEADDRGHRQHQAGA